MDNKTFPKGVYRVIDTDLARDNIENDIPAADLEDLRPDENEDEVQDG